MTAALLALATTLVVTGVAAAAGTVVARGRTLGAVAGGVALLIVANGHSLTAGPTERSLATAAAPLLVALAAVALGGWRPTTLLAYAGAVLAGPVRQLLDDPFHDPSCLVRCDPNPLVVSPHPALADLAQLAGSALLLLALLATARRTEARTWAVAALGLVTVPLAVASEQVGALIAAAAAAAALAADLLRASTRSARLARSVTAMSSAIDPDVVLAEALGVASVSLGYPVANGDLVDRGGRPLPDPAPGEAVVDIAGPEGRVAQLRGNLNGVAPKALAQALRGPARLALENNRLAAEAAVRTEEIRSSAERLVLLAERGRRGIERDLHDGAQRHVLTLGLAIQSAPELSEPLRSEAASTVRSVLNQLRDVAHGIRPPQLDTGGLAHAWAVLADRSTVPVEVGAVPVDVDRATAGAAYRLLDDTLRTATAAVTATCQPAADGWTILVTAAAGGHLTTGTADQFRALGGRLRSARAGAGWHHEGHLPPTLP